MEREASLFFSSFTEDEISLILNRLQVRRFSAGDTVIAEGEQHKEIYIVRHGSARVLVSDRHGESHVINRIGPGSSLGEVSFFTGSPASATVVATSEMEVAMVGEDEFLSLAQSFPRIYHNVGAILAERLSRASRRAAEAQPGRAGLLIMDGANPLAGYALACSVAWHTRGSVVLLVVADALPAELQPFSLPRSQNEIRQPSVIGGAHAIVSLMPAAANAESVIAMVDELCQVHDHVLVQVQSGSSLGVVFSKRLRLVAADRSRAEEAEGRRCLQSASEESLLYAPELTREDCTELKDGVLPATTSPGRIYGWAARAVAALRVGVAFGAGGSRGFAHAGVLAVLERIGLSLDCVAGTSVGAAAAALHASGRNAREVEACVNDVGAAAFKLGLSRRGLLSIDGLRDGIRGMLGDLTYETAKVPCAVVTADITNGEQIVFSQGPMWPAVVASVAIPGIYPPQRVNGRLLTDGGIVNPLPSDVAAELGADVVLAVKLYSPWNSEPHTIVEMVLRAFYTMQSRIMLPTRASETLVIEPSFAPEEDYSLRSFTKFRRAVALGETATEAALPRIKSCLPWLRD